MPPYPAVNKKPDGWITYPNNMEGKSAETMSNMSSSNHENNENGDTNGSNGNNYVGNANNSSSRNMTRNDSAGGRGNHSQESNGSLKKSLTQSLPLVALSMQSPQNVRKSFKSLQRQDSCHSLSNDAVLSNADRLDVRVVPATHEGGRRRRRRHCDSKASIAPYRMRSLPRGKALVVEIEEFENDVYERRHGSNVDVDNLTQLFQQLHFEVVHEKDLNYRQFIDVLTSFSRDKAHETADMAIIVVLTHGAEGRVYTSDGRCIHTESILSKFNNQHCPGLMGKPKLFILQACRGDQRDKSYLSVSNPSNLPLTMNVSAGGRKRYRGDSSKAQKQEDQLPDYEDSDEEESSQELDRARPTWEDMIIAYSSIPGYESLRDHDTGSWFIRSLVEVFMNHAHEMDLLDLLMVTSQVLSKRTTEANDAQTCNVELRHIYKRVFFNPGLPNGEDNSKGDRRSSSSSSNSPPSLLKSPDHSSIN